MTKVYEVRPSFNGNTVIYSNFKKAYESVEKFLKSGNYQSNKPFPAYSTLVVGIKSGKPWFYEYQTFGAFHTLSIELKIVK